MKKQGDQVSLFKYLDMQNAQSQFTLIDQLQEILSLGKGACYNRINGNVELTYTELQKISNHFKISLDNFFYRSNNYLKFELPGFQEEYPSANSFLTTFSSDLEHLINMEDVKVFFLHNELPFFHYFQFKELSYFKFYIWDNFVWKNERLSNQKFSSKIYPDHFHENLKVLYNNYSNIESLEIINSQIFDNTIAQIRYMKQEGGFEDDRMPKMLINQLFSFLDLLKSYANESKKVDLNNTLNGSINLYYNESIFSNTMTLVHAQNFSKFFFVFDNPNVMHSMEENVITYGSKWFQKIIDKSVLISQTGGKQRKMLFRQLEEKLQNLKEEF